jgi:methyltransferase (TIGR00027 family)
MEQKSMTALVSAFARAYHSKNKTVKVFDDFLAEKVLGQEEMEQISFYMAQGIQFFNPGFSGTKDGALRWIVDNQLAPSPLGRAAFAEGSLQTAARIGAGQYIVIAAGYDTFACRQPNWANKLQIFELDHPATSSDKQARLTGVTAALPKNLHFVPLDLTRDNIAEKLSACAFFDKSCISFCSMLGLSYYLAKEDFLHIIKLLADVIPNGSSIVFDYPDEKSNTDQAGARAKKQAAMAARAGEKMLASYSYEEMELLLSDRSFLIYEHLTPSEITRQYFAAYNQANPKHIMTAFDNVNYCLAVKNSLD